MARRRRRAERRRWQRVAVTIPVFVRGTDERGKEFLEFCSLLNISAGGALLGISRYARRSCRLSLEIPAAPLPGGAVLPGTARTLIARVVRTTVFETCHLCGLRFIRPLAS